MSTLRQLVGWSSTTLSLPTVARNNLHSERRTPGPRGSQNSRRQELGVMYDSWYCYPTISHIQGIPFGWRISLDSALEVYHPRKSYGDLAGWFLVPSYSIRLLCISPSDTFFHRTSLLPVFSALFSPVPLLVLQYLHLIYLF